MVMRKESTTDTADPVARTPEDVLERARTLDRWALTPAEILRIARQVRTSESTAEARIAFAGNVVHGPLPDYLIAHLACDGIRAVSHDVPFGQLMQNLLQPASELRRFDPTFIHLHYEIAPLLQGALDRREYETVVQRRAALEEILEIVQSTVRAALAHTRAVVLLGNFVGPRSSSLGLADFRAELGEREFILELNLGLARWARSNPRIQILDMDLLTAHHGRGRSHDRRLYYVSKIPWSEGFFPHLADELARHVKVTLGHVRKCLVVDLDNTLWDGVLGEDGPLGVRVGMGDPVGEAHSELQRRILALKQRGILLAACSKNNPEDVDEVFRLRPDMPLRVSDFAHMEIGWAPKHEGLQRIAHRLNIGTDSLVFLDDSQAEIALVRKIMPEVECIRVPAESSLRSNCLDASHGLDRVLVTAEDVAKDRQYGESAAREASRADFTDLHEYLRSLETFIVIRAIDRELIPRALQLFLKTNQFNVTGRRYSYSELEQAADAPGQHVLMVHARDRFGDMGWIGAALLRAGATPGCHIDNLVLSCRALGRGIEIPFLNRIRQLVFDEQGCSALTAEYRPSKRNAQVRTLFESQGFATVSAGADEVKHYVLARHVSGPTNPDWITVSLE